VEIVHIATSVDRQTEHVLLPSLLPVQMEKAS